MKKLTKLNYNQDYEHFHDYFDSFDHFADRSLASLAV